MPNQRRGQMPYFSSPGFRAGIQHGDAIRIWPHLKDFCNQFGMESVYKKKLDAQKHLLM